MNNNCVAELISGVSKSSGKPYNAIRYSVNGEVLGTQFIKPIEVEGFKKLLNIK